LFLDELYVDGAVQIFIVVVVVAVVVVVVVT